MANQTKTPKLGLDFGRVIVGGDEAQDADTPFLHVTVEEAVRAPPNDHAIETIRELVRWFDGNVWIVSHAGPTIQRKTLAWLMAHDFWIRTGMTPWSICFTLDRESKADVAEHLRLTHFVDDRLDVLEHIKSIPPMCRYLFGPKAKSHVFPAVKDWQQLRKYLSTDLNIESGLSMVE